jgi:hypothetical protein
MTDTVAVFADEARRLREWVLLGSDAGPAAAREALFRITRLYLAALALPPPWSDDLESGSPPEPPRSKSWQELYPALAARLPFQHYGEVFNPVPEPFKESTVGDLADAIADIFGDVDRGLRLFEADSRAEAIWQWGFNFVHHWGEHATSAIRALHCYLAAECPEELASRA